MAQVNGLSEVGLVRFHRVPEAVGVPASNVTAWNNPANAFQVTEAGREVDFAFWRNAAAVQQHAGQASLSSTPSNLK